MPRPVVAGGVVVWFLPKVAKGTEWDEVHVLNTSLQEHATSPDLMPVVVASVPRGMSSEVARRKVASALGLLSD